MESTLVRQTAFKATIKDILDSSVNESNGITIFIISGCKVSRVSIIGTVVSCNDNGNLKCLNIEDETGNMMLQYFDSPNFLPEIGSIVRVIGKIRLFASDKYIVPEIVKPVKDVKWVEIAKREIEEFRLHLPKNNTSEKEEKMMGEVKVPFKGIEAIIHCIRTLDDGNGSYIDTIIATVRGADTEFQLQKMLEDGIIFETSPGKVKILE